MKYLLVCCAVLFSISISFAQIDDPGLPGGDPDVPLDGGVALLLIAGVSYGIKRIKDTKQ